VLVLCYLCDEMRLERCAKEFSTFVLTIVINGQYVRFPSFEIFLKIKHLKVVIKKDNIAKFFLRVTNNVNLLCLFSNIA